MLFDKYLAKFFYHLGKQVERIQREEKEKGGDGFDVGDSLRTQPEVGVAEDRTPVVYTKAHPSGQYPAPRH